MTEPAPPASFDESGIRTEGPERVAKALTTDLRGTNDIDHMVRLIGNAYACGVRGEPMTHAKLTHRAVPSGLLTLITSAARRAEEITVGSWLHGEPEYREYLRLKALYG